MVRDRRPSGTYQFPVGDRAEPLSDPLLVDREVISFESNPSFLCDLETRPVGRAYPHRVERTLRRMGAVANVDRLFSGKTTRLGRFQHLAATNLEQYLRQIVVRKPPPTKACASDGYE